MKIGTSDLWYNGLMEEDWEKLKEEFQSPEYADKFIAAAIRLIIDGDSVDES